MISLLSPTPTYQPATTVLTTRTVKLPQDLTAGHLFCLWLRVQVGDKTKKKPYSALTGKAAHTNNFQDFTTYSQAVKAFENSNKFSGIGRLLQHPVDSIYAIDVDHCVSGGVLNEYAYNLVRKANSYAEFSPSGKGIRIFGRAPMPAALEGRNSVKIWVAGSHPEYPKLETQLFLFGQYVTITGNQIAGTPNSIADNEEFLLSLLRSNPAKVKDYFPTTKASRAVKPAAARINKYTIDYAEFGKAKPKTVNFWIKRLKETNAIFTKNWFRRADKGLKSNSEYQWDLVKTAYFTCQDELSPADMAYMLERWCILHQLDGQIKLIRSRVKSNYAKAAAAYTATGQPTRRQEKNRKLRETRRAWSEPQK